MTSINKTSFGKLKASNKETKPRISKRLYMLEPIIFPIINSDIFFCAALIDVIISGKEVPKATKLKARKESEIPKKLEISITESTVNSAPKKVKMIENIMVGNPMINGFLKTIFVKKSLVSNSFSFFDIELLKDLYM